jgi:hypothetical protein
MKKLIGFISLLGISALAYAATIQTQSVAPATITVPVAGNQVGLTINQNDTTNNPNALFIGNAGTGASILMSTGTSGGVGFKAPSGVSTPLVFTLPTADGSSQQCLQTNGGKVLSWGQCSGGGGGSSTLAIYNGGTQVSSPTAIINFSTNAFTATFASGATSQITLLASSVTLQGNTFNGTSQLVQTTAGGALPVLSATNLTSVPGANVTGAIPAGSLGNAILNQSTLQASSVFNTSSGTVGGQLQVNSVKFPDGTVQVTSATAGSGTASPLTLTAALGSNQTPLSLNQNDTANNPDTEVITTTGTGRGLVIRHNGHTGSSASSSGAFFLDNTNNDGIGAAFYTNHPAPIAGSAMVYVNIANQTYNRPAIRIDNIGTSSGDPSIVINSTGAADAIQVNQQGMTGNGITIAQSAPGASAAGLQINQTGANLNAPALVIQSTGTGSAIRVTAGGFTGGSRASTTSGLVNINMTGATSNPDGLVIVDGNPDAQVGSSLLRLWATDLNRNDPILRINKTAANSGPGIRIDANTQVGIETYDTNWFRAGVSGLGAWKLSNSNKVWTIAYRDLADTTFNHLVDFEAVIDTGSWSGVGDMVLQNNIPIVFVDGVGNRAVMMKAPSAVTGTYTINLPVAASSGTVQSDSSGNWSTSNSLPAGTGISGKTLTQLKALAPAKAGELYYCSDCTTDGIVVSTGTTTFGFGRISARTTSPS